jgi:hypothetical protein
LVIWVNARAKSASDTALGRARWIQLDEPAHTARLGRAVSALDADDQHREPGLKASLPV